MTTGVVPNLQEIYLGPCVREFAMWRAGNVQKKPKIVSQTVKYITYTGSNVNTSSGEGK